MTAYETIVEAIGFIVGVTALFAIGLAFTLFVPKR